MAQLINLHATKVPNPKAMKFEVEGLLLTRDAWEFKNAEEAQCSPLATKLFAFNYVDQVFISINFVTVNLKENGTTWDEALTEIRAMIKRHLELSEPLIIGEPPAGKFVESQEHLEKQMIAMIEDHVRPATREDGGDITFKSFEDGVLKLSLSGACVGCPFGPRTVKNGVEVLLKQTFPEIKEVTSDDIDWSRTQR